MKNERLLPSTSTSTVIPIIAQKSNKLGKHDVNFY